MDKKENTKGISLIEIVLVIVILGISIGMSVLYYQTSQVRADINTQVSQFTSYVRLVHSNAFAGLNNQSHGIHLEPLSYTTFIGSSYNESDPNNFEIELPPTIIIQNILLNGGGSDLIFSSPNGETDDFGSLDFFSDQINKTVTVEISRLGTVTY